MNTNFTLTLLKFFSFAVIIEAYYLASYLLSVQFLNSVEDDSKEFQELFVRHSIHKTVLLYQKEVIFTNGTATLKGQNSATYLTDFHEDLYDAEEEILLVRLESLCGLSYLLYLCVQSASFRLIRTTTRGYPTATLSFLKTLYTTMSAGRCS